MIETKVIYYNPLIIHHKIYSFSNEKGILKGVKDAVEIIKKSLNNKETFDLLMDFSGPEDESSYNMAVHRKWAESFKENNEIKESVRNVAIFAKDSPKFRAEKENMEDDSHKWFTSFQEAIGWLQSNDTQGKK